MDLTFELKRVKKEVDSVGNYRMYFYVLIKRHYSHCMGKLRAIKYNGTWYVKDLHPYTCGERIANKRQIVDLERLWNSKEDIIQIDNI